MPCRWTFSRIQFTPDLMPSDITGTEVIQEDKPSGTASFASCRGRSSPTVMLADEINRTPPKTQAALLEAMQEHQVTVRRRRNELPEPFFVLATQNPIEQEGTYPLPEAQLDRFMFNVRVDYPDEDEELEIVKRTTADTDVQDHSHAVGRGDRRLVQHRTQGSRRRSHGPLRVADWPQDTTRTSGDAPEFIREYVMWGAGPRASQYLVLGAKARAVLRGRTLCQPRRHSSGRAARPAASHQDEFQRRRRRDYGGRHGAETELDSIPDDRETSRKAANSPKVFRSADAG